MPAIMKQLQLRHVWVAIPIAAAFALASIQSSLQPDLWWHLACGRWTARTGHIMRQDPFTFTIAHQPVVDQNWLAEVLMYEVHRLGGIKLLTLLTATLYTGAFLLMLRCCWLRARHYRIVAVCGVLGLLLTCANQLIRPQAFAAVLFSLTLMVLWHFPVKLKALFVALIMLMWTNMHGSFALGVVLPAIFLTGRILQLSLNGARSTIARDPLIRSYSLCFLLSIAAAFCNPQPAQTIHYVTESSTIGLKIGIQEWQRTSLTTWSGIFFYASILMSLFVIKFSRQKMDLKDALLLVALAILGARSGRLIMWWGLALSPILAGHLATLVRIEDPVRESAGAKPALIYALLGWLIIGASSPWWRPYSGPPTEPRAMSEFLKTRKSDRVFHPMGWGGYLIWHNPEIKVFVDGRVDPFPISVWQDYDTIADGARDWENVLDKWRINELVTSRTMTPSLVKAASQSQRWTEVHSDPLAVVFEKRR
jgi:hypothetical protein